jgi:hypothetical protein
VADDMTAAVSDLEMVTSTTMTKHHAIETVVVLKRTDDREPEAIAVEPYHRFHAARCTRDAEMSVTDHSVINGPASLSRRHAADLIGAR